MPVPFLELKRQHQEIKAELVEAFSAVLDGGVFILGPEVTGFEKEWSEYCGFRDTAAVANGTSALALALTAAGLVRPGQRDEIITSPLAPGYTALAVTKAGGVPVFADIDPTTYLLDPASIAAVITKRTRGIVPVHLYGQLADMAGIHSVAARYGLEVIEDAAQAHGTYSLDTAPHRHSRAVTFSFYPTKNLGACGDGGAVAANDIELIDRVRLLREGGSVTALGQHLQGSNDRMDELQAALLRVKLPRLAGWNKRRSELARLYDGLLQGTPLVLPKSATPGGHVYHLYVVRHESRDGLRSFLAERGIQTLIHYPQLLHQQELFRRPEQPSLPVAERIVTEILSLPLYPQMRDDELRETAAAVAEFFRGQ